MRLLSIVRHAKSDWNAPARNDADRPLNARGERDAPAMGKRLAGEDFRPDLVISSPARRAMQTATALCQEFAYPPAGIVQLGAIYEATLGTLQSVVESLPDEAIHVMLVGHNPGFEALCNYTDPDQPLIMTTCNVAQYELDIEAWSAFDHGCGDRYFHYTPKD
ncbi:histidine phosphatase family protein [Granulosicoccaceae sp. 1_MG-2023]|nr:histidine phosphatase family protein [Granulosicoccaceae sp. 1_MG-2023]